MDSTGYHYLYDPAGNIASKQEETSATGATMTTYTHNNLNQLTATGGSSGTKTVVVRGSTNESATVKVMPSTASVWKNARMLEGNRFEADVRLVTGANQINIQAKDGSDNVSDYTYALTLAAASAASPTYDADGNMTSDGVRTFDWDMQSRLVRIVWGGSPVKSTEYQYNALGQRSVQIEKSDGDETARYYYLYEGAQLLCRYSGGDTEDDINRQYFSQGEQREVSSSWVSYYYNRDHLGSIREVMNSDGSLAARYDYDPYGKRVTQYQATDYIGGCDLGYTGHITQESPVALQGELVLTLFRACDPEVGRWLSADPMGEDGGINLYEYAYNFPIGLWDARGEEPIGTDGDSSPNRYTDDNRASFAGWDHAAKLWEFLNPPPQPGKHYVKCEFWASDVIFGAGGKAAWKTSVEWAALDAGKILKDSKLAGVGKGARSGQHGKPFTDAAAKIRLRAKQAKEAGELDEYVTEMLKHAKRFCEKARGINHK